jgi:anti-sigma B factor antagonist
MNIEVTDSGDPTVVAVAGEVDAHNCSELGAAIIAATGDASASVVLDAAELAFIDSSALSELLRVSKLLDERGGSISIVNAGASVHRVLEITGLLATFGLEDDSPSA